jgi:hypothetical protein
MKAVENPARCSTSPIKEHSFVILVGLGKSEIVRSLSGFAVTPP